MGVIRKTASVATLGLVRFRSKSEKLERATADLDRAQARLVAATATADENRRRARRAERRARKAEVKATVLSRRRRGRRWGRKKLGDLATTAGSAVSSAADAVTPG